MLVNPILIILMLMIPLGIPVASILLEKWNAGKRQKALERAAAEQGLVMDRSSSMGESCTRGSLLFNRIFQDGRCENFITGKYHGKEITFLDIVYTDTTGTKILLYFISPMLLLLKRSKRLSAVFFELPHEEIPVLLLKKRGLEGVNVFEDYGPLVTTENLAFNRNYLLNTGSRKLAYDLFHPRMMELFLEETMELELRPRGMLLLFPKAVPPEELESYLDHAFEFDQLLPDYFLEDPERFLHGIQG